MNKGFDLTKILDGCPQGTKFYSPLYRDVEFVEINKSASPNLIYAKVKDYKGRIAQELFRFNGAIYCGYALNRCNLFPSKEQRDWSKFERFWDKPKEEKFDPQTFQPFDKVLVRGAGEWICGLFSHLQSNNNKLDAVVDGFNWWQCIPFNEETKHLVGSTEDCPEYYKWWEE